ncbi:GNAT family acetyltransferase [Bacillus toyonensis]|uniref:GNAT family acetyltransferase n=1 Tax=Bacillus toyonensis TaxID=155322 RepID=A0A2C3T840_9BACI|nr:hypothetical protein MC28_1736 [Bacillus thuringiensis MC28]AXK18512.1 GNAT family acetyltransferase [Bacillus sp. COPE52]EEL58577.1 Hydroxymethylglutaryl-CoA lyase [Bacillus cereus Rock4-18]KAB2383367.1 GNAT family acetyltransferase [Bacillus toyonensis]MBH0359120.1 GNAT family acetyltransferase [Bacillus toyonensis biovar Thuringiensis]OTW85041.1 GNAT family acetyltransferase [Bacillus thuringiensis serovar cameroun]OTW99977.1 GNAT family acetyltransferase [Bacillus thuringiensis serovar
MPQSYFDKNYKTNIRRNNTSRILLLQIYFFSFYKHEK